MRCVQNFPPSNLGPAPAGLFYRVSGRLIQRPLAGKVATTGVPVRMSSCPPWLPTAIAPITVTKMVAAPSMRPIIPGAFLSAMPVLSVDDECVAFGSPFNTAMRIWFLRVSRNVPCTINQRRQAVATRHVTPGHAYRQRSPYRANAATTWLVAGSTRTTRLFTTMYL